MAYAKPHTIRLTFTTKMGVNVTRTVTLTDTTRSNAVYRAKASCVPAGATNINATAVSK